MVNEGDSQFPGSYKPNSKVLAKKGEKWALAEIYQVKNADKFFKPIRTPDCDDDDEEFKAHRPKLYIDLYLDKLIDKDIITEDHKE